MYSDTLIYRGLGFGFDHSTTGPYYQFFLLHVYQPNTYLTMCDINFSLAEDWSFIKTKQKNALKQMRMY